MKSRKEKQVESRTRIDASKVLILDERVALLQGLADELKIDLIDPSPADQKRFQKTLESRGFEPMMFSHAMRVLRSKPCKF